MTQKLESYQTSPSSLKRPFVVLMLAAVVSLSGGIGFGLALRLNDGGVSGGSRLNPKQSFPVYADWPSTESDVETLYPETTVLDYEAPSFYPLPDLQFPSEVEVDPLDTLLGESLEDIEPSEPATLDRPEETGDFDQNLNSDLEENPGLGWPDGRVDPLPSPTPSPDVSEELPLPTDLPTTPSPEALPREGTSSNPPSVLLEENPVVSPLLIPAAEAAPLNNRS